MSFIKRLFTHKSKPTPEPFTAVPAPARLLYVVGDIHGCDDLLSQLLEQIDKDANERPHDLVFVGDYVDRGEASASVLKRLHQLSTQDHVIFLMGNHERMLLDFLNDPGKNGRRWIRNGGLQTLASFGVGGVSETASPKILLKARDTFEAKLGPLKSWLENLQPSFQSGNVFTTHAAAHPQQLIQEQTDKIMLWGHGDFFQETRQDGTWVAHGHYVMEDPVSRNGRISVDTGAYATGRLTAAKIEKNGVSFLSANRL